MARDEVAPAGFSVGAFIRLAVPMTISRAGLATMGIADGVMLARHGSDQLAWMSLADGTLGRVLDVCVAFLIGGLSLVPRAYAAGDSGGARLLWLRTLPAALLLGAYGVLAGWYGEPLLLLAGQAPALAREAGGITLLLGAGYPAALIAIAAAVYLEGIRRAPAVAVCVVLANLLNIALNWVLIGGNLGAPAMGARGSALATTCVRCMLGLSLATYAWFVRTDAPRRTEAASPIPQWTLGLGAAATVAAMAALTWSLTLFAGRLGTLGLATYSAAWNLGAPAGLLALGLADAAGILVGGEAGRAGDSHAVPVAWAALRTTLVTLGLLAIALTLVSSPLAHLYTQDAALADAMTLALPLVAAILVCDAAGFVMAASLRALREVRWPVTIEIGSMMLLTPLAALLAFWMGAGVNGLFGAMLGSAALRAALLTVRLRWRSRATNPVVRVYQLEMPC